MEIKIITSSDSLWSAVAEYARTCSWRAGAFLADMMEQNRFSGWERVLVAMDGEAIAGYCTVQREDCIPGLEVTPFICSLFVGEAHRGHRNSQRLIEAAMAYLGTVGFSTVYLFSDHVDFYEKYGFRVISRHRAPWGEVQKLYQRDID